METIKVENVKEAIDEIYRRKEYINKHVVVRSPMDFFEGKTNAFDECITILENLIVRRQRNEP